MKKNKLIRITTVPVSLRNLLKGQHRFMSAQGFEVIGVSSSGKFLQDVETNEGIRVAAIEMTRKISPITDFKALYSFYKLCKKEKPKIVHSHTPKAGIIGMLGAKLAGVPIRLHTVAGLPLMEEKGIKRKVLNFVEKVTYKCATKVYPNSYGLYDFILENKFTTQEKMKVIGNGSSNGIDTGAYNAAAVSELEKRKLKEELGIGSLDFVFVFVGRLVGDKGINELVKAFKRLTVSQNDLSSTSNVTPSFSQRIPKLLLVGPFNSDLDPLQPQVVTEIENNPRILTVGFQDDVRPYHAISDVLVFPSYREGFPNVVMQAGAMGLPSIVTDINGCNEIITDGLNGVIIPPKKEPELLQAMVRLMEDREYYTRLRDHARDVISSRYEQSYVWKKILEEYKTLQVKHVGFSKSDRD